MKNRRLSLRPSVSRGEPVCPESSAADGEEVTTLSERFCSAKKKSMSLFGVHTGSDLFTGKL